MGPARGQHQPNPLIQHPRGHRSGVNLLPDPDNPRRHGFQFSTALMVSSRYALANTPWSTSPSPPHSAQPLSWVWKKSFIDNETAKLTVDRCTASAATFFTQIRHIDRTSLPPSHHQWKAVRSGQPARRGPRTFSIFSLIQPLSGRR